MSVTKSSKKTTGAASPQGREPSSCKGTQRLSPSTTHSTHYARSNDWVLQATSYFKTVTSKVKSRPIWKISCKCMCEDEGQVHPEETQSLQPIRTNNRKIKKASSNFQVIQRMNLIM